MSAKTVIVAGIFAVVFLSIAGAASNEAQAGDIPSVTDKGNIGVGSGYINASIQTISVQGAAKEQNASADIAALAQRSSDEDRARQAVEGLLASLLALVAVGPIYGATWPIAGAICNDF